MFTACLASFIHHSLLRTFLSYLFKKLFAFSKPVKALICVLNGLLRYRLLRGVCEGSERLHACVGATVSVVYMNVFLRTLVCIRTEDPVMRPVLVSGEVWFNWPCRNCILKRRHLLICSHLSLFIQPPSVPLINPRNLFYFWDVFIKPPKKTSCSWMVISYSNGTLFEPSW